MKVLRLRPNLLPPPVRPGTNLGLFRPEIARTAGMEEARVITSCSHQLAAALVGLPAGGDERFGFLQCGQEAVLGIELARALINKGAYDKGFSNEMGYGESVRFSKRTSGLWILDECRRFWNEKERDLEPDVLNHLAISAPPFESLINPEDPRFLTPGDMPLKIQAFCKETNQTVPRKPGPTVRCVLESLALLYRKTLEEAESLSGRTISNLYLLGNTDNTLLNHFISNALQVPVIIAPSDATAIGNIIVQALALGHLRSLEEAREIVRSSFKIEVIAPRGNAWAPAFERLDELVPA